VIRGKDTEVDENKARKEVVFVSSNAEADWPIKPKGSISLDDYNSSHLELRTIATRLLESIVEHLDCRGAIGIAVHLSAPL
jgi:hypothetical protein